jgi:hypothetical protein
MPEAAKAAIRPEASRDPGGRIGAVAMTQPPIFVAIPA